MLDKAKAEEEVFEVFPENWDAVRIFVAASTQWNIGFSGATGLNYTSLDFLFKLYKIKDRREVFEHIQVIEGSALKTMREKQEESRGNSGT